MNTSCLQENLSKGLAVVGRAVATHPALPVLSHVLLAAQKTTDGSPPAIHLAAADLDASVEGEAAGKGHPVEIAFTVRFLLDALSAMDEGEVALETTSATHAGVLRPVRGESPIHVIMPLSVRER